MLKPNRPMIELNSINLDLCKECHRRRKEPFAIGTFLFCTPYFNSKNLEVMHWWPEEYATVCARIVCPKEKTRRELCLFLTARYFRDNSFIEDYENQKKTLEEALEKFKCGIRISEERPCFLEHVILDNNENKHTAS